MFSHGVSKDKSVSLPGQSDGISNLKCFPCYSQVVMENLHMGSMDKGLYNVPSNIPVKEDK